MKKYRVLSILLTVVLLTSLLLPFSALAAEAPEVSASHAILMDANYDEVLYEKSAREKAYPASITKVMTALLVAEAIDRGALTPDTMVTASATAMSNLHADGSSANIKEGETLSVRDLLYCLLLPSANEAANILAEAVSGDVDTFVALMNQRAQELGCTGTHFANPHGLHDDNHYTTAYDICLFTRAALEHDLLREVMGSKTYTTAASNIAEPRTFYNTNALLSNWHYIGYVYNKVIAGKTGTTDEAGRCLVSAAVDGDTYLLCVVMGVPLKNEDGTTNLTHFSTSKALLQWGFSNFRRTTISKGDTPVAQVEVTLSQEADCVMVKPVGEFSRTLPKDLNLDDIESTVNLFQESVQAPVEEGQVLGTMTLSYEDEVFGTLDLVAVNSVERSELLYRKAQVEQFFSHSGVTLLLSVLVIAAVVVILRLFVFRKRRRPSSARRRSGYRGRRRF